GNVAAAELRCGASAGHAKSWNGRGAGGGRAACAERRTEAWADGRPLPEVPPAPALCGDPVAVLRAASPAIDGWTAAPLAGPGQRLDLAFALLAFGTG